MKSAPERKQKIAAETQLLCLEILKRIFDPYSEVNAIHGDILESSGGISNGFLEKTWLIGVPSFLWAYNLSYA